MSTYQGDKQGAPAGQGVQPQQAGGIAAQYGLPAGGNYRIVSGAPQNYYQPGQPTAYTPAPPAQYRPAQGQAPASPAYGQGGIRLASYPTPYYGGGYQAPQSYYGGYPTVLGGQQQPTHLGGGSEGQSQTQASAKPPAQPQQAQLPPAQDTQGYYGYGAGNVVRFPHPSYVPYGAQFPIGPGSGPLGASPPRMRPPPFSPSKGFGVFPGVAQPAAAGGLDAYGRVAPAQNKPAATDFTSLC